MHNEFLHNLIKKSDLNNTNYHVYNKNPKYEKPTIKKITFEKVLNPNFIDYIVLDFETTGLSHINDTILEIGAIKVRNNEVVDTFNTLINPKRKIPPHIQKIVKITDNMVVDKPCIEEILNKFVKFLDNDILVIHNASFDMRFLIQNTDKMNILVKNRVYDTLNGARSFYKDFKKHSLAYLCEVLNITNKNAHRALSDCFATYEVYKKLYEKYMI